MKHGVRYDFVQGLVRVADLFQPRFSDALDALNGFFRCRNGLCYEVVNRAFDTKWVKREGLLLHLKGA